MNSEREWSEQERDWTEYAAALKRVAESGRLEYLWQKGLAAERASTRGAAEKALRAAIERRQRLEQHAGELDRHLVATLDEARVPLDGPRAEVPLPTIRTAEEAVEAMDRLQWQLTETAGRLRQARDRRAGRRDLVVAAGVLTGTPIAAGAALRLIGGSWIEVVAGAVLVVLTMLSLRTAGGSAPASQIGGLIAAGMACAAVIGFGPIGAGICLLVMLAALVAGHRLMGWHRGLKEKG